MSRTLRLVVAIMLLLSVVIRAMDRQPDAAGSDSEGDDGNDAEPEPALPDPEPLVDGLLRLAANYFSLMRVSEPESDEEEEKKDEVKVPGRDDENSDDED
jgi:hypothetical protein